MDSSSAWAGREWFVVRKAEVRLSEVRAVFPEATKRGGWNRERGKGTHIPSMVKVVCLPM